MTWYCSNIYAHIVSTYCCSVFNWENISYITKTGIWSFNDIYLLQKLEQSPFWSSMLGCYLWMLNFMFIIYCYWQSIIHIPFCFVIILISLQLKSMFFSPFLSLFFLVLKYITFLHSVLLVNFIYFLSFINTLYLCSSWYMFLFLFLIWSYHDRTLLLLPFLSFIWGIYEMKNAFKACWLL